jgi:hypothetical protein
MEGTKKAEKENQLKMISDTQCPGCGYGYDARDCKWFQFVEPTDAGRTFFRCDKHAPATYHTVMGKLLIGLPRGFCRLGPQWDALLHTENRTQEAGFIRLWEEDQAPEFDKFNIPVWALEHKGYLFIRTFMPRVNWTLVDVIENGKLQAICPHAVNVGEFYDEID